MKEIFDGVILTAALLLAIIVALLFGVGRLLRKAALLLEQSLKSWHDFALALICLLSLGFVYTNYPAIVYLAIAVLIAGMTVEGLGHGLISAYEAFMEARATKEKNSSDSEANWRKTFGKAPDEMIERLSSKDNDDKSDDDSITYYSQAYKK